MDLFGRPSLSTCYPTTVHEFYVEIVREDKRFPLIGEKMYKPPLGVTILSSALFDIERAVEDYKGRGRSRRRSNA